jgi:hypothetical protein
VALTANEYLDDIIDVSNRLISLLDTYNSMRAEDSVGEVNKAIELMKERQNSLHQLFERFSPKALSTYQDKINVLIHLDKIIIEKANSLHEGTKEKLFSIKKNKKAIITYQNT